MAVWTAAASGVVSRTGTTGAYRCPGPSGNGSSELADRCRLDGAFMSDQADRGPHALAAVPVYLTGEPAAEMVENLPGVSEQIIELHEEWALLSLLSAIATGVLAFGALILKRFSSANFARISMLAVLLLSFAAGAFMARTANLGGEIRHTEIRSTAAQNANPATETKQAESEEEDED